MHAYYMLRPYFQDHRRTCRMETTWDKNAPILRLELKCLQLSQGLKPKFGVGTSRDNSQNS